MFVTESNVFNIVVPSLVPSLRINPTAPDDEPVSVADALLSESAVSESVSPEESDSPDISDPSLSLAPVFVEAGAPSSAEKNSRPFRLISSLGDELPAGLMSWTRREPMKSSSRVD